MEIEVKEKYLLWPWQSEFSKLEVAFKQLASAVCNYPVTRRPRWRAPTASGHLDFGIYQGYALFWVSPGL